MREGLKITIVTLLVVTTLGCSKQSLEPIAPYEPSKNAMVFDAYNFEEDVTEPNTRGAIKKEFQNGNSFGVMGYYLSDGVWNSAETTPATAETPNFMYNQPVSRSNASWNYAPIKYWPYDLAQKIKFFAYYPHNENNVETNGIKLSPNTATGYPTIEFIPKTEPTQQVDFMTAQTGLLDKEDGGITLSFEHQLSQVTFSANHNSVDTYAIVITTIALKGTKVCTRGTFASNGFLWSNDFLAVSPTYTLTADNSELIKDNTNNDQAHLPKKDTNNTNHKLVSTDNGILLLHPQLLTPSQITITVTFSVTRDGVSTTGSKEIKAIAEHHYVKGKRTNYTFTIDTTNAIDVNSANVTSEILCPPLSHETVDMKCEDNN